MQKSLKLLLALWMFSTATIMYACGEKEDKTKGLPMAHESSEPIVGNEEVGFKVSLPLTSASCGSARCAPPIGTIITASTNGSIEDQYAWQFTDTAVDAAPYITANVFSKSYAALRWGIIYLFGFLLGDQPYVYGFSANANGGGYNSLPNFCMYGRDGRGWYGFPQLAFAGIHYNTGLEEIQSYTGTDGGNCGYDTFNDQLRVTIITCDSSYATGSGLQALNVNRRTSASWTHFNTPPTNGTQMDRTLTTNYGTTCKSELWYGLTVSTATEPTGYWYGARVPKINPPELNTPVINDITQISVTNVDGSPVAGCAGLVTLNNVYDLNESPVGTPAWQQQLRYTFYLNRTPPCVYDGPGVPVGSLNIMN